ncbi:MAG TPA: histidine phosphatase family protein [Solirubrobacteraceae bacterium]|nr:histidine phosphatase family protein [Solirubrobacteraceae bacterium]
MARSGPSILLIRHGETEWSRSGQHTSTSDVPLTEEGRARARALGARLAGRSFALVLTSPMIRARDTAALAGLGDRAEVTEDLHEVAYGSYEGRTTPEIRVERPGWDLWTDGTPDGEPLEAAGRRADRVLDRAAAAGGDVALVAHGHILRVLGARWIGLPAAGGGSLALDTAALCDLGFERERRVIWAWNDTGTRAVLAG